MIPINLAIIGAGASAQSRQRGFLLGSTYGGAMALVYGVLGLIVILTAGTFGTINSSPWFNLGIAILFVVLGLAMFDVLLIDFSKYSAGIGTSSSRGSFGLAFTMGAVAALFAGPASRRSPGGALLEQSLRDRDEARARAAVRPRRRHGHPWPVAGGPGRAAVGMMVRVKQVFGALIIATAAFATGHSISPTAGWTLAAASTSSAAEGGMALVARGQLAAAEREQKPVMIDMCDAVQPPRDGQDDAGERGRAEGARGLREDKYQAEDPTGSRRRPRSASTPSACPPTSSSGRVGS
jgi:hypothetical protein